MELLNCPFCGGKAFLNQNYSRKYKTFFFFVRCDDCGASGRTCASDESGPECDWNNDACHRAERAWNKRSN